MGNAPPHHSWLHDFDPTALAKKSIACYKEMFPMKPIKPPLILVHRVGQDFHYYIQQGNNRISFSLDQESHESLKRALLAAEASRNEEHPTFSLHVVGS